MIFYYLLIYLFFQRLIQKQILNGLKGRFKHRLHLKELPTIGRILNAQELTQKYGTHKFYRVKGLELITTQIRYNCTAEVFPAPPDSQRVDKLRFLDCV